MKHAGLGPSLETLVSSSLSSRKSSREEQVQRVHGGHGKQRTPSGLENVSVVMMMMMMMMMLTTIIFTMNNVLNNGFLLTCVAVSPGKTPDSACPDSVVFTWYSTVRSASGVDKTIRTFDLRNFGQPLQAVHCWPEKGVESWRAPKKMYMFSQRNVRWAMFCSGFCLLLHGFHQNWNALILGTASIFQVFTKPVRSAPGAKSPSRAIECHRYVYLAGEIDLLVI